MNRSINCILLALGLMIIIPLSAKGQRDIIEFDRISIEQGLSQSTIFCILQDHKGFMWFGTEDGLNRYDGYEFKVYNNDPLKEGTIASNRVIALIEDNDNNLWIGTIGGGLNRFDYKTETFTSFRYNPNNSNSLSNDRIMSLCEDPSGKIWIGTADGGVNLFDPQNNAFKRFLNTPENPNLLPDNVIRALEIDSSGDLWIGTNNGVSVYNIRSNTFKNLEVKSSNGLAYKLNIIRKIFEDSNRNIWIASDEEGLVLFNTQTNTFDIFRSGNDPKSLGHNSVHDVFEDDEGAIWIASYGGLQKFNPDQKNFESYKNIPNDPKSLSSNLTRSIYQDRTGVMWVGTYNDGVNKFSKKYRKFTAYRNQPNRPLSSSASTIRCFYEDSDGIVWIATYGHGLLRFNPQNETFKSYRYDPQNPNSLSNDNVTAIIQASNQKLWIGTTVGLCLFDKITEKFKVYKENPLVEGSLPNNNIRCLFVDSNNELWIGSSGGGLIHYNRNNDSFKSYLPNLNNPESSLSQDRVLLIFEDSYKNLWIGTSGEGLNIFNRISEQFTHIKNNPDDSSSLSSNRILCMHQDSKGRLWIGTGGGGLNLYDYETQSFIAFRKENGLPNDVIYGILEDNNNNLWLSTNYGIAKFNPNQNLPYSFRSYTKFDGLQSNEFSEGAYMKSRDGSLYFGGISGFNVFDPNNLQDNPNPPEVYVTSLRIDEKKVQDVNQQPVVLNLLEEDQIVLPYNKNNVTIYYTALHYFAPEKNSYKHILEGFEVTWINSSPNQRFATYTNLKPGKYTFRVASANSDGVWCTNCDSLTLIIKPPYWETWWFIVLVVLLSAGLIIGLVFIREASLIRSKRELEKMIEIRTAEITRQNQEISIQAEKLKQANDEIIASSEILSLQNKDLHEMNEEITAQRNELEEQRNSLANLAWELQEKNEEITSQRNEIQKQRDQLTAQKKEITDSIMYAKRIQQAILPTYEQIKDCFPDFFIFYRPKSIVSGDFYWTSRVGNHRIIAVVDCTGHGVPGGFMSMLGMMMLNEVISQKQILDPSQVLNYLRENIISVLHQKGDVTDAGDGMDISLCIINDEDLTLHYSGANSSMIILQPDDAGNHNLIDVISDRMPISYHLVMRSFKSQKIQLKKNSVLYLYSDGLTDQFSGEDGKKLQIVRFKNFILENKLLPLKTQGIALEQLFDKWKGNTFQVDDVLVMGLRV